MLRFCGATFLKDYTLPSESSIVCQKTARRDENHTKRKFPQWQYLKLRDVPAYSDKERRSAIDQRGDTREDLRPRRMGWICKRRRFTTAPIMSCLNTLISAPKLSLVYTPQSPMRLTMHSMSWLLRALFRSLWVPYSTLDILRFQTSNIL